VVPRDYVLPIPRQMSFLQGAAFTHVYLTAYHALRTSGRARRGDWVVVTAAGGGVGTAAIQLCLAWDLRVIAGVGSESKFQLLEKLGVQYHVNYRSQSLASYVKQITGGKGADLVLESVGGEVFREALDSLAAFGRIVLFGVASGEGPEIDCNRLLATSSVFAALNLSVFFATAPSLIQQSWNKLIELYCAGKLKPVIGSRFPLAQAAEAHRLMESRTSIGKILLDPAT
jgi:NADPH2:quinone reductase